jgi:hypothetical protein
MEVLLHLFNIYLVGDAGPGDEAVGADRFFPAALDVHHVGEEHPGLLMSVVEHGSAVLAGNGREADVLALQHCTVSVRTCF